MLATYCHHDGNPWPWPSGWQPLWPGALPLPHGGTLPHSLTGPRAGWGAGNVGGFLFATAWRSRNPRGGKFLETFLSAHVSSRNLRGEKFFTMFLSAYVVPRAPARTRYQPKPARNGHAGGAGAPVRHQCAERSWKRSFSPRTFRPENRVKRSFSKSISPHRFRLRQTVPKRCQKGTCGHHDGHGLPA